MLVRLLCQHWSHPLEGRRLLAALQAYRGAQDRLRAGELSGDLALAQIETACKTVRESKDYMQAAVSRWMEQEPLRFLRGAMRDGLPEFLRLLRQRGTRIAACSDYPAEAKLEAMGIRHLFDAVVSAQDPHVQKLKPHPRSLMAALDHLGTAPERAVFIGDRPELDAAAAEAAGIPCLIIGGAGRPGCSAWRGFDSYHELAAEL
jgi:HAD superfamily hydrolase (TIGR01509 family)